MFYVIFLFHFSTCLKYRRFFSFTAFWTITDRYRPDIWLQTDINWPNINRVHSKAFNMHLKLHTHFRSTYICGSYLISDRHKTVIRLICLHPDQLPIFLRYRHAHWIGSSVKKKQAFSQSAFYVNLYRAVIGPSG